MSEVFTLLYAEGITAAIYALAGCSSCFVCDHAKSPANNPMLAQEKCERSREKKGGKFKLIIGFIVTSSILGPHVLRTFLILG